MSEKNENDLVKAKSVSVGDHVTFGVPKPPDKTESAHGLVERIERSGKVKLPGTNETEEASSENPVAVIRVYATVGNGKRIKTDRRVIKPFSSLKVSSEPIDNTKMYDEEEEKMYHKKKKVKKSANAEDMFSTKEEAVARSKEIGCSGTHTFDEDGRTMFMPCSTHKIYEEIVNEKSYDEEDYENMEKVSQVRLKELVEAYNKNKTGNKRITVGTLMAVYRRGIGAYRTNPSSVRGSVSSPEQWAMGRVNAFMAGLRGRFPRKSFDLDLFPKGHPRATKKSDWSNSLLESVEELKKSLQKSEDWEGKPLYDMLSSDEKAFADSLLKLSEEIGPLDQAEGIWIGYEYGPDNENASIGVKCGNCALHKSSVACAIISLKIEEEGACRLAVIPDGYVNSKMKEPREEFMEMDSEVFKSDDDSDAWDNELQKCWVGYRQEGLKRKGNRMVPNCVPVKKSEDGVVGNDDTPNKYSHSMEECTDKNCPMHGMNKREYSDKERQSLARRDMALPDGSFPIVDVADLRNAIQAVGRSANYARARNHIIRRAESLNQIDLLPEEWKPKSAKKKHDVEKRDVSDIDLKPTETMANNAKRGLELRAKFGRGGTAVGVARARDLSNRTNLSPETVARMYSFFSRHEVDKKGKDFDNPTRPSNGKIAWLLWGGDSGFAWSTQKWKAIQNARASKSDETWKDSPFFFEK